MKFLINEIKNWLFDKIYDPYTELLRFLNNYISTQTFLEEKWHWSYLYSVVGAVIIAIIRFAIALLLAILIVVIIFNLIRNLIEKIKDSI